MMQPRHDLGLYGDVGLRLGKLRREATAIEACENLTARHPIAFLNQHLRDAFAAIEGKFNLTKIHVAVQEKLGRTLRPPQPPPQGQTDGDDADDYNDESGFLLHAATRDVTGS